MPEPVMDTSKRDDPSSSGSDAGQSSGDSAQSASGSASGTGSSSSAGSASGTGGSSRSDSGSKRLNGNGNAVIDLSQTALPEANLDSILGRVVVEQGLATPDEVQYCLVQQRGSVEEVSQRSLAQLLVNNDYVTQRQMVRLRQIVEAERSGQQIPGYNIIGKLGAGAMATVFKARQVSLDRMVAIKVLPKRYSANVQFIERFYAEGRAAAALNHPNIVQAFDVGKAGDYHYFVMEYVEGRTVYDDIVKNKRYSEGDALDVIIQVAEALEHAHAKGLIHRDVKPKNVMISKGGTVKLADMGLARAVSDKEAAEAEAGKAFGTPYYISPEQVRGEVHIGPQADIYSLGATLFQMVTGKVPFSGKSPSEVMHKHLKERLTPPDHINARLSAGISEIIEMMMAKSRRDRYKSMSDVLTDLRSLKRGEAPPIARHDTDLSVLEETSIQEAQGVPEAVHVRTVYSGNPFSHPAVVTLLLLLILSLISNILLALFF
jgi:eukaryotic-like serine/threonine-protein kinase